MGNIGGIHQKRKIKERGRPLTHGGHSLHCSAVIKVSHKNKDPITLKREIWV